jgi:hypothetical protein
MGKHIKQFHLAAVLLCGLFPQCLLRPHLLHKVAVEQ